MKTRFINVALFRGMLALLLLALWGFAGSAYSWAQQKKSDMAISCADNYLGTPYLWGGTTKNGIDCSALMQNCYRHAGLWIPRTSWQQADYWKGRDVSRDELKRGDLVFFRRGKGIGHVGLVTSVSGNRVRFIHSSSNNGGVAYNYLSGEWVDKFVKGKRLRGASDAIASTGTPPVKRANLGGTSSLPGQYPEASQRRLTTSDIQGMSRRQVKIMKNEIFARHGYKFHINGSMISYFEQQAWYRAILNKTRDGAHIYNNKMSEIERRNVDLLKRYE